MAIPGFPVIEDIVEELSTDLEQRGFSRIQPKEEEVARYEKRDSPIGFQAGLEQNLVYDPAEAGRPQFNHVYVRLEYVLPEGSSQPISERVLFPGAEIIREFFRNSQAYQTGHFCLLENVARDRKVRLVYSIGFKKDKTDPGEMKVVLREFIDYCCNYAAINTDMIAKTRSFSE